ncbi:MAG: hypothetical protein AAFV53_17255 [Myxococcota bacterium]
MSNPYREAHRRIRQRKGGQWSGLLPIVAAALATPLARPVLLGFLDVGVVAAGVEAVTFRFGALIAAAMALHTYTDLVRGSDRAVLDPHPVQPRALLSAIAVRTARERVYLPIMAAILLSPIAWEGGDGVAWAGASALMVGAWLCALGVGFATHLGSVWAGLSPQLAGALDALRGSNPRMQAALIYAPGFALAVVLIAVGFAAAGLSGALQGWAPGWAFLALPPVVGVLGWFAALPLAEQYYVRATALLSEVDAQWAGVEEAEEASSVYLDWLAQDRPEMLRALRQGWRRLRIWPTGAWVVGCISVIGGWTEDPIALTQVLTVSGGGVLLISGISIRMAEGDPVWLDNALGVPKGKVAAARGAVALLYAQGAVVPAVAVLALRHGFAVAGWALMITEGLALGGAALAAGLASQMRGRGAWVYGPTALLLWAAIVGNV